jgi:hypothetical protein
MRLTPLRLTAPLVLTGMLIASSRAQAQGIPSAPPPSDPNFWQATAGVVAINGLTWAYNWYVQRWDWANVGTRAWWNNLRDGFIWDDDAFMDNQFAHPYHGSFYHNAARASGYDFWGSTPFVVAGSLGWELLSENCRPSLNDLINTTLGGIALGEVTFRLSTLLASSHTPRGTALGREAGAFVLSPVGRMQTLLGGRARSQSTYAQPESHGALIQVGRRHETVGAADGVSDAQSFIGLKFQYGSPFAAGPLRPYDAFEFDLQMSPEETGIVTRAAVSGLLARKKLVESSRGEMFAGLFQHFDYEQVPGFKASSQSLSGALLFRRQTGQRTHLALGAHLEAVPLGAVLSEHNRFRKRDYDYGPGVAGRLTGALQHGGRDVLRIDTRMLWIHSVYGADANHVATTAQLSAMVPVIRTIGVGADVGLTFRRSIYQHKPSVFERTSRLRAYLIWSPSSN